LWSLDCDTVDSYTGVPMFRVNVLPLSCILKVQFVCFCETLGSTYQTGRCHNPEVPDMNVHHREQIKISCMAITNFASLPPPLYIHSSQRENVSGDGSCFELRLTPDTLKDLYTFTRMCEQGKFLGRNWACWFVPVIKRESSTHYITDQNNSWTTFPLSKECTCANHGVFW
jgi:hypothetical protein